MVVAGADDEVAVQRVHVQRHHLRGATTPETLKPECPGGWDTICADGQVAVQCRAESVFSIVTGEPFKQSAELTGEPIKMKA